MRHAAALFAALTFAALPAIPALAQADFTQADAATLTVCLATADDPAKGVAAESCIGKASATCMQTEPDGQSTLGMTQCSYREQAFWDGQLNAEYAALKTRFDPALFAKLREAQRAWISYRDLSCGVAHDVWGDGSMRHIALATCLMVETARRAIALRDLRNLM